VSTTGRLSRTLTARAARVVFGANADAAIDEELASLTEIDQAHLVMLEARGLVGRDAAAELLTEIQRLRASGFAELRGRRAPRGLYLLYESHLIDRLGAGVGGVLHTGRSRNDLKATMHQLRMRASLDEVVRGLLRLQAVLLARARAHQDTVMPVYSQFQPSVPGTYGHYLVGVAEALDRDVAGLLRAAVGLRQCPLGAAGGAGTDVAVDPAHTASLLGFTAPVEHAAYAIASRDTLVRILSSAVLAGVTLSRLATDLQQWSTPDADLVWFPDELVGSSSAMPQKRNPFLLEHLKGGAGALIGAWTAAVSTMKATPFGNSVEVSTDGVAHVWPAMDQLRDLTELAIAVVAHARPRSARMLVSAHRGFTVATAIANRLVAQGIPFRVAHSATGELVTDLITEGVGAFAELPAEVLSARLSTSLDAAVTLTERDLDPAAVAAATRFGGGPGAFVAIHDRLTRRWRQWVRRVAAATRRHEAARGRLADAVAGLLNTAPTSETEGRAS
jgi:argininosuccinate lyase